MDDAPAVGRVEGLGQLVGDLDDLPHRQQLAPGRRVQRLPFHVLHHDEQAAVGLADLVDLADERVIERGRRQRLAAEPLACEPVGFRCRRQQLHRDPALEAGVLGEEDFTHAACAKWRQDPVASRKGIHVECVGDPSTRADESWCSAFSHRASAWDAVRPRQRPVPKQLRYAIDISEALSAAHGADIVHRDVRTSARLRRRDVRGRAAVPR